MEEERKVPLTKDWIGKSSQVAFTSYNPMTKTMSVRFATLDKYDYYDVPMKVWEASLEVVSIGSFINSNIKGKYSYKKVG